MSTQLRTELADVGREFYQRGWMLGTAGNLSARIADDPVRYAVTASGGHKGRLQIADFIEFELGLRSAEPHRKSSAETVVHDELYATVRPGAILHVHSPYVTLVSRRLASAGEVVFEGWEYVKGLGFWDEGAVVSVPIVPNHHDIPALGRAVRDAAGAAPAVLVAGHGVYAWGASVADAQRHIECLEFLCHMVWEEQLRR
jgi:methylthioribulose-1-phosphate dehydratase